MVTGADAENHHGTHTVPGVHQSILTVVETILQNTHHTAAKGLGGIDPSHLHILLTAVQSGAILGPGHHLTPHTQGNTTLGGPFGLLIGVVVIAGSMIAMDL